MNWLECIARLEKGLEPCGLSEGITSVSTCRAGTIGAVLCRDSPVLHSPVSHSDGLRIRKTYLVTSRVETVYANVLTSRNSQIVDRLWCWNRCMLDVWVVTKLHKTCRDDRMRIQSRALTPSFVHRPSHVSLVRLLIIRDIIFARAFSAFKYVTRW